MNDPLFEIEDWRGSWYYKYGSCYTGPYTTEAEAMRAARLEAARLNPQWRRYARIQADSGAGIANRATTL